MRLSSFPSLRAGAIALSLIMASLVVNSAGAQSAQQKRDSAARADSMSMPGMGGMKMQPKKSPAKKTAAKKVVPKKPAPKKPVAKKAKEMQEIKDTASMKEMPGMTPTPPAQPAAPPMSMPAMTAADTMVMAPGMMAMTVSDPLGITMERLGSGTTWIPDAVSLPSRRFVKGTWSLMLHGFVFAEYDHQSGPRGDDQFGSLNWAMFMASRAMAGGRFQIRTMLSLDAATVTRRGYPLLLQSGESYRGQPLHDRQHPHDFWMELAAMYERPITDHVGLMLYAAPSGEPALGPVAFMHRPSAMDNPTAPLTHHWQDATHVSFGVITAGIFTHDWKLEGSAFNGREPDDRRWNFDPIRLDSYSTRFTFNSATRWSLSLGYGYLKSPEALRPEESIHRITASALHGARVGTDGQWASALIWGANKYPSSNGLSHSLTAETEAILDRRNTILARAELIQKTAEDLALDEAPTSFSLSRTFNVGAISVGYIREIVRLRWATVGLGALGTLNVVPSAIEDAYGSQSPTGALFFVRLRPFHEYNAGMIPIGGLKH